MAMLSTIAMAMETAMATLGDTKRPRLRRVYARLPSFNPYVGTFHHAPSAGNRGAVYFSGDIVGMGELEERKKYRNHPLTGTFHALPGYYDPLHKLSEFRCKDEGLLVYSDTESVRSFIAVDLEEGDELADMSVVGPPQHISRMHSDSKFAAHHKGPLRPRRFSDADAEDFFAISERVKANTPNPNPSPDASASASANAGSGKAKAKTPQQNTSKKVTSSLRIRIRSRSNQIAFSSTAVRPRLRSRNKSAEDSVPASSESDSGSLAESTTTESQPSFDPELDNGFISTGKGIFRRVFIRKSNHDQSKEARSRQHIADSPSLRGAPSIWSDDLQEDECDGEYNQAASRTPLNPFVARRLTDGDDLRLMPVYRHGAIRESIPMNADSDEEDESSHPKPFFIHESAVTDQYQLVGADQLGDGSYAVVKPAIRRENGAEVAIKQIHKRYLMTEFAKNAVAREIEIHLRLKHRHIVRLYEVYETQDFLYLVMAKATRGNLKQLMVRHRQIPEPLAAKIAQQLMRAVFYLHESGVVHCDLKPENLLLTDPKDSNDTTSSSPVIRRNRSLTSLVDPTAELKTSDLQVAVCDFGLAVKVPDVRFYKLTGDVHKVPYTGLTGTPGYIAPELFQERSYGKPADMWSTGIIIYEMLAGYQPFYPPEACCDEETDYNEYIWRNISAQAKDLVARLLEKDPAKRITAAEALAHGWFEAASFAL